MQTPIYYVSRNLRGAEESYLLIEKLTLALVITAQKLRHYFQAHTIRVLTNQPLRQVLTKPDAAERLLKWAIELSEFNLQYKSRTAIKAQALADFLADLSGRDETTDPRVLLDSGLAPRPTSPAGVGPRASSPGWMLYVDWSATSQASVAGLVLISPTGDEIQYALCFLFTITNNEAEYEALIARLKLTQRMAVAQITINRNSLLVVNQITSAYEARGVAMQWYLASVKALLSAV